MNDIQRYDHCNLTRWFDHVQHDARFVALDKDLPPQIKIKRNASQIIAVPLFLLRLSHFKRRRNVLKSNREDPQRKILRKKKLLRSSERVSQSLDTQLYSEGTVPSRTKGSRSEGEAKACR